MMSGNTTIVGKLVSLLNYILTIVLVGHVSCSVWVGSQSISFKKMIRYHLVHKSVMKFDTSVSVSPW